MSLNSLHDLLLDELRDIYSAELQLMKVMPRMVRAVRTPELKRLLSEHIVETEEHIHRLEDIFDELGERGTGRKSRAMAGLLDESEDLMDDDDSDAVRDAALVGAAQRVEHHEIAAYSCAITHAELLGMREVAELLQETLREEKRADDLLSRVAEEQVNDMALAASAWED